MKNEITVKIYNREYRLITDETREHTDKLAGGLNRRMAELLKAKPTLSVQDAAALISLECCDELVKARQSIENIRSQIKDYVDDAGNARQQADDAQKELRTLRERVAQLEKEVRLRKSFTESSEKVSAEDIISQDISKALENKYPYNYGKK